MTMKKIALVFSAGILVLGLILTVAGQTGSKTTTSDPSDGELTWYKYDKALEIAKEDNKHVIAYFTTVWCGYCKMMQRTTFKDPAVVAIMTNDFVLAWTDGDSKNVLKVADKSGKIVDMTERQLTKSFGVRGYPTFIFLKPDGTGIAPVSGYWKADKFKIALEYISSGSYEKMQFSEFSAKYKG